MKNSKNHKGLNDVVFESMVVDVIFQSCEVLMK